MASPRSILSDVPPPPRVEPDVLPHHDDAPFQFPPDSEDQIEPLDPDDDRRPRAARAADVTSDEHARSGYAAGLRN